jgi:[ribosomal protein S5]-alanine N-acetyltransferase
MPMLKPHLMHGALSQRPQPELIATDLTIRPWRSCDVEVVIDAFADPDIAFWHRRTVESSTEAREWLDRCERQWKTDAGADWAVCDGDSDEVLGRAALSRVSLFEGVGVVGYWVRPLARGRGVAPRAVVAVSSWALRDLGLQRLELAHSMRNSPSCRVAVKAGFEPEGTLKSALRHADGYHDMHLHALVG